MGYAIFVNAVSITYIPFTSLWISSILTIIKSNLKYLDGKTRCEWEKTRHVGEPAL